MVQSDQKSVVLVKYILSISGKPGQLVLDSYTGMHFTAKMCLFLNKHTMLVGCDEDVHCLQKSSSSLVEINSS